MKTFCLILFFVPTILTAQRKNDYLSAKKQLSGLSCGSIDSTALFEVYEALTTLDTMKFTRNMWIYYLDLGMVQYQIGVIRADSAYNLAAVNSFESGLKLNSRNLQLLWNLGFQHYLLNNCDEMETRFAEMQSEDAVWLSQNAEEVAGMRKSCGTNRFFDSGQN